LLVPWNGMNCGLLCGHAGAGDSHNVTAAAMAV